MRGLTTGVVDWFLLGHVAYFVVMAVVGIVVAAPPAEDPPPAVGLFT